MAKRLDQIVVVDVESTCWAGDPPAGQQSEIIEIGVCTLEVATGARAGRESILVAPQRSTVSEFCTGLTTLTQEQVRAGHSFAQACQLLKRRYLSRERVWASWGDYDRRQFERQCHSSGVGYPFGPGHLNIKTWYALVSGSPHEVGMDAALRQLGLPLEGTHHRGVDDAWNIAGVLSVLLSRARAAPG
ncbi:MAG TPA: 3'-5' exonuclease [Catenuloplanes sp.]|jgi:inhibitor of KinA sporulation pathway (predicted exonuclease)